MSNTHPANNEAEEFHEYDDRDPCPECGGGDEPDALKSACIDDLCHGGDVPCMHGEWDSLPCGTCGK